LHGVSVSVGSGELIAILGPNGAGKSTLLKTLAGQLPFRRGSLELAGERVNGTGARSLAVSGVVLVPQGSNVFRDLTVAENLALPKLALGRAVASGEAMLERFPILAERAGQPAGSLSGGERQILAMATALLMRPKVLLLDEPTTGLSPQAMAAVADVIASCVVEGVAVMWVVEQMPEVALEHADRAHVMEAGEITYSSDAAELLKGDRVRELLLEHT